MKKVENHEKLFSSKNHLLDITQNFNLTFITLSLSLSLSLTPSPFNFLKTSKLFSIVVTQKNEMKDRIRKAQKTLKINENKARSKILLDKKKH
jgi:hypothetical protein